MQQNLIELIISFLVGGTAGATITFFIMKNSSTITQKGIQAGRDVIATNDTKQNK